MVEVPRASANEYHWEFLLVNIIYEKPHTKQVILRGIRFTRTRNTRGILPCQLNEVCALYDLVKGEEDEAGAVDIGIESVIRTRDSRHTNALFPAHRANSVLVQRWKFYRYWSTARDKAQNKSCKHGSIVRLMSKDIRDVTLRVSNDALRSEFRGGVVPGGSYIGNKTRIPTVDVDEMPNHREHKTTERKPGQKYIVDDMFCGAGGVSRGICQSGEGFRLGIACDADAAACRSYRANFPEAELKCMGLFELTQKLKGSRTRADIVHLSPPCQVWSPAHTRAGKNDAANVAALYTCEEILKARRPRLSTGEQTYGLLFDSNEDCFNGLIGQYTRLNYSVTWDMLKFRYYGLPTSRKRLVWIASCIGERLPSFPPPTHGYPGLPRELVLRDTLKTISKSHGDPLHDVNAMLAKGIRATPYDDNKQTGTITTSGSDACHPSGKRHFTRRELAALQGFPTKHTFLGTATEMKRQIGNAFPPTVVATLYKHLEKWLLRQDRVVTAPGHHYQGPKRKHGVIIISDDDDDENSAKRRQHNIEGMDNVPVVDDPDSDTERGDSSDDEEWNW
ncbi:S-adenosyl-L-methionine-dependent methyltransferase [Poronia punctata]|nr:S-adenosyl-L-methionine-dependent methyltransferase [Poronia punctata]